MPTPVKPIVKRRPLERLLFMGLTGSGKTYTWLRLARRLKQTGAIFRVIDTDNAVDYMLLTQFPDLLPEEGGNVYVWKAFDWHEYEAGVKWIKQIGLSDAELKTLDPALLKVYKTRIKPIDWVVVDMADNAWQRVQNYFIETVFSAGTGDYLLQVRKRVQAAGGKGKDGKDAVSIVKEATDGWKDWPVINKLYDDFMLPVIYQVPCHVYMTTKVEELDRNEKDPEVKMLFGGLGLKPAGQKRIGHQAHTIFLALPGKDKWYIRTAKDRAGRTYYPEKPLTPLTDFYNQYLVMKAGWDFLPKDPAELEPTESEETSDQSTTPDENASNEQSEGDQSGWGSAENQTESN